jgi:hypothetical protein
MLRWLQETGDMLTKIRWWLLRIGYAIAKRRTAVKFELFCLAPSRRAGLQFALKPVTLLESELWEFGFDVELHTPIAVLRLYAVLYSMN